LKTVWAQQYARDLADEQLLAELPTVMSVRPPSSAPDVTAMERDPKILRKAVMLGREAVHQTLAA
jgi:hypothetical protein